MSFKVPEQFRWNAHGRPQYQTKEGDTFGMFIIPGRHANGRALKVMAVDGEDTGWEHVSVSLADGPRSKQPSWPEMCIVKNLFWDESDCVVQFHPPEEDYVNIHDGVLHLWRCVNQPFPMPQKICV